MEDFNDFKVRTEVYEGPLDALLSLIEKRKLLINDISLSKVADDFMDYVRSHESFPTGQAAHFILIASTLLLIKSKSLLPNLELTIEEEESISDLELRLKILSKFRELSGGIKSYYGASPIYEPLKGMPRPEMFSPAKDITLNNLAVSILSVVKALPKVESLPKAIVKKVISLEEMVNRLTERVQKSLKMNFTEFTKGHMVSGSGSILKVPKEERVNVIVSFLAVLELVKQGIIRVNQEARGGSIEIESQSVGIPNY